jgi:hypothetical protein
MPANKKSKYAPGAWRTELFVDVVVPSGQLCQVRRVGPTTLINAGLFDRLDFLGSIVSDHVEKAEAQTLPPSQRTVTSTAEAMAIFQKDPRKVAESTDLIAKVIEMVVVQPKILRPIRRDDAGKPLLTADGKEIELADEEREPGVVYTDYVELLDQMFLFQFVVGGTHDLETFRAQYGEMLAGLDSV